MYLICQGFECFVVFDSSIHLFWRTGIFHECKCVFLEVACFYLLFLVLFFAKVLNVRQRVWVCVISVFGSNEKSDTEISNKNSRFVRSRYRFLCTKKIQIISFSRIKRRFFLIIFIAWFGMVWFWTLFRNTDLFNSKGYKNALHVLFTAINQYFHFCGFFQGAIFVSEYFWITKFPSLSNP